MGDLHHFKPYSLGVMEGFWSQFNWISSVTCACPSLADERFYVLHRHTINVRCMLTRGYTEARSLTDAE